MEVATQIRRVANRIKKCIFAWISEDFRGLVGPGADHGFHYIQTAQGCFTDPFGQSQGSSELTYILLLSGRIPWLPNPDGFDALRKA